MVKVKPMLKNFSGSDPEIWMLTSHDTETLANFLKNCYEILSPTTEKSDVTFSGTSHSLYPEQHLLSTVGKRCCAWLGKQFDIVLHILLCS